MPYFITNMRLKLVGIQKIFKFLHECEDHGCILFLFVSVYGTKDWNAS